MATIVRPEPEPWPRCTRYRRALKAIWMVITFRWDERYAHWWVWYGDDPDA